MKHIKLFESFDINESKDPLLAIIKKGNEAVPTELEQFLAEVEKKGPGTTGSEKALKRTFNQIARMTAPGSKPYENEKIFKYIKDKAKKQKIEIDMDAVEKFAKNTKGYTKKNEGALNEGIEEVNMGLGMLIPILAGFMMVYPFYLQYKEDSKDNGDESRIKKGLNWIKKSISSISNKFKKAPADQLLINQVEVELEKDGSLIAAEKWIQDNITSNRKIQKYIEILKGLEKEGVNPQHPKWGNYEYSVSFLKKQIDQKMKKLKFELPEVAKIINDQLSNQLSKTKGISENRIIKRFDDLK